MNEIYNRQKLKAAAKDAIRPSYWILVLTVLIYGVITGGIAVLSSACFGLGGVINLVIGMPLLIGVLAIFRMSREKKIESSDLSHIFDGFRENLGRNIGVGVLMSLYTFLWSLLFVVPGIIKSIGYSMAPWIALDHPEMTASQCIAESTKMMMGHKGEYFVLMLSFIGWALLSCLTFGVGFVFLAPYVRMSQQLFYRYVSA
jgi:uncharacterized membrane protein